MSRPPTPRSTKRSVDAQQLSLGSPATYDGLAAGESLLGRSEKIGSCTLSDSWPVRDTASGSKRCENNSEDFTERILKIGSAWAETLVYRVTGDRYASCSSTDINVDGGSSNTNGLPTNLHARPSNDVAPGRLVVSLDPGSRASCAWSGRLLAGKRRVNHHARDRPAPPRHHPNALM